MTRVIFIVPAGASPLDYLDEATEAGAGEILVGVPPALLGIVDPADLPTVYREGEDAETSDPEPEPDPDPEPVDTDIADRIRALEDVVDYLLSASFPLEA